MSEALKRAHEAMRARREAGEVIERLDPMEKARRNPTSRALAIAAKCWDCQGGNADPGVRRRVGECSITRCPLHPVRPYQRGDDEAEPE
jgi:hypothetical protein